jgi:VCBS repeat-containing protein
MSNAVATVAFLQGQAWAKSSDGSLRPLALGSVLNEGEILVTAQGAQVQLDFGDGAPVSINGGQEIAMSRDFNSDTATDTDEALLDDASIEQALTVLEQGGDLLEELEETAAGDTGGGSSDGGNSFVRLTRILEATDPQAFAYDANPVGQAGSAELNGSDTGYLNRAPDVVDQTLSGNEDEDITGQIIASDIEGDELTYTLTTGPVNGTLVLDAATGQFTFTANANYNGSDSFIVTVTDSRGNTGISTINLNIAPVNDAPVSSDINLTTDEDTPVNGQVVAEDIEGDTLTYSVSGQPTNGTVALDPVTGAFVYTPNANYNGSDSFVVTISDGNGGTTTSKINIGVIPVNDAPVSSDQQLVTDEDTPVSGQVAASDVDGDSLIYSVSGQPANGSVSLNSATGGFVYTPNADYNGSDSFVVTVDDGNGGTTTSLITIDVNPVNDAPVSSDQNLTTNEDTPVSGQVAASDVDGDSLTYSLFSQPVNGTVTLNPATGGFIYSPTPNFNGSDSFVVTISDGNGGTTTSKINIGVIPVNDAPNTSNLNLTTPENVAISSQVKASDVDGDSLLFSLGSSPAHGTVSLNSATGTFVYTPTTNFNGGDSFTVIVSDGNGGTATSLVVIGVTPVNDAPVSSNQNLTTNENVPINGAISATDADGDTLTYTTTGSPANGSVVLNSVTGAFTYTPNTGYSGSDSFVVTISDGNGGVTTSTVNIGVNAINHAPTANDDTAITDEGIAVAVAVRGNDTDPNGDSLTVTGVTQGANGSVVIDAATGNPIYTPNAGFTGTDSFTYTISDGGATSVAVVTVTVNPVVPVNQAPVAVADAIIVAEGGTVSTLNGGATSVLANDTDADGDPLTAVLVSGPANGSLVLNPNGTFNYIHNGSETTTDSFTYKVNDGTADGNTVTVNITVTPVNDAPVANDDFYTINENQTLVIPLPMGALTLNDTDAEGDTLSVSQIFNSVNGSVSFVGGDFVFTPNANFSGTASFDYRISDGKGGTATATVHITVVAVDDPTIANPDTKTTAEDTPTSGNVLNNDSDADNALTVATFSINGTSYNANDTATIPGVGTFTLISAGNYLFQPAADYHGSVPTITYTTNTGASSTLDITVTPVNDAPVANDDYLTTVSNVPLEIDLATLLANDTDVDGDSLTVFAASSMNNGTLSYIGGKLHFTPTANFTGPASFTYSITDGNGAVDSATVHITVTAVPNVAPETNTISVTGDEDSLVAITLSGSDVDGTVTGYVIKSLPTNGVLYSDALMTTTISAGDVVSGSVYFMPNADWNGTTNFDFAARDNLGLEDPTPATATITINPLPDPGLIGGTTDGEVKEDTTAKTSASGTLIISDPDSGEAEFNAKTNSPGDYGFFSIDKDGAWTYTIDNSKPAVQALKEGETKFDTFSVSSIDGTATTVIITVKGTNDGPVAGADSAAVNQDALLTLTPAQLLANDFDVDGDTLVIDSVQGAMNGSVELVGGNVEFTPTAGYHGPASFTYTISDGNGGTSTATVNVNVTKANTPPVANDDSATPAPGTQIGFVSEYYGYRENTDGPNLTSIQQAYSFINGRSADATFIATTFDYGAARSFSTGLGYSSNLQTFLGPDAASLSADPGNTSDAIIRMRGFVELDPGTYNFKVSADDGYQIRVDGVIVAEYNQNNALHITEHSQFTISTSGLHAVEIVYWDQGGYATLKMELSDNNGLSYDILSSIPTYQTSALTVLEDQSLAIPAGSLLTNDTDADGDALTVVSVQAAVNGSVALVGGDVVFTPAPNYNGPASFTYTISDGKGGTATATVSLVVAPVNDAPVAVGDNVSVKTDGKLEIPFATLTANDIDIDGDSLTIISVQDAVNGTVAISNNKVVFTPTLGYEGPASFTYTVRDPVGATSTATVSVSVGNAIAPSIVVAKTLLAIAHGTGGTSVSFPLITKLVDTDGSESLSIKISGVTGGLNFSAGTNLGSGVWQFTEADLTGLMLNIPGSFNTGSHALTVAVTSTEANGGFTATTSTVVSLKATYTHVDITTTEAGSYTGNNANEFIQGGSGDNVINAGNGNNIIYGNGGNDTLTAGNGSDIIYGGSGNDNINSGTGADRIIGGAGNDTLQGGPAGENFVDVFVWSLGDQGTAGTPAIDTINNFATQAARSDTLGGDVLDLRDLLQVESVGPLNSAGNLADYLHFEVSGGNTIIHISHTGGFTADSHSVGGSYTSGAETQQIVLNGVNLQTLYSGATTDQQIITQLLNNNKLITD